MDIPVKMDSTDCDDTMQNHETKVENPYLSIPKKAFSKGRFIDVLSQREHRCLLKKNSTREAKLDESVAYQSLQISMMEQFNMVISIGQLQREVHKLKKIVLDKHKHILLAKNFRKKMKPMTADQRRFLKLILDAEKEKPTDRFIEEGMVYRKYDRDY